MNETRFKAGDRVRVVDPGSGNSVEVGDTGTVTDVSEAGLGGLVTVRWDRGGRGEGGVFAWRLEHEAPHTSIVAPAEVHAALDELWAAKQANAAAWEAFSDINDAQAKASNLYTETFAALRAKQDAFENLMK